MVPALSLRPALSPDQPCVGSGGQDCWRAPAVGPGRGRRPCRSRYPEQQRQVPWGALARAVGLGSRVHRAALAQQWGES